MGVIASLLVEEHGTATQRRRAEIELALWNAAPAEERERASRKGVRRADWIAERLGLDSSYEVSKRLALLGHGDAAGPLWERLEQDMTLSAAYRVSVAARKTRGDSETHAAAVLRCLAEHDARPHLRRVGGKIARGHSPTRLKTRPETKPKKVRASRSSGKLQRPAVTLQAGTFWQQLRELIGPYVHERLSGLDEAAQAHEATQFEGDLKVLLAETQQRLDWRGRDTPSLSHGARRRRFREACHVLRLDPPKTPLSKTWLGVAKKRFRSLAKEYHPDRRGDATRAQYEAVLEAWHRIQRFFEQENTKGTEP